MAIILDELTQSKLKKKEKLPLLAEPSLRTAKPFVTPPPVIPPLQPSAPPMIAPNAGPVLNTPVVAPLPSIIPQPQAGDPRSALTLPQRALTNPTVSKAIDWLSGGVSFPEAERYSQEQVQNLKNLGKVPFAINPFTPVEKQEEALQALSTPLETIFRPATAIQKLMFPTRGESRPESAIKALIRPDKVPPGYLGGEISKRMPAPQPGSNLSLASPRVLIPGIAGALGELLSFELGLGSLPSRLGKGYQAKKLRLAEKDVNKFLDEATPKIVAEAEKKGIFPQGWNEADKLGRTRSRIKQMVTENPEFGEAIMKRQTPRKVLFGDLAGERASKELPGPFKPKPEDIKPLIAPAAQQIPKTPTQIE